MNANENSPECNFKLSLIQKIWCQQLKQNERTRICNTLTITAENHKKRKRKQNCMKTQCNISDLLATQMAAADDDNDNNVVNVVCKRGCCC